MYTDKAARDNGLCLKQHIVSLQQSMYNIGIVLSRSPSITCMTAIVLCLVYITHWIIDY